MQKSGVALCFFLVIAVTGCASNEADRDHRDPLESVNRPLWTFNHDLLDKYVLRPAAVGYSKIPASGRKSVNNFFLNLEEPAYSVNSLLQGNFKNSGASLMRFVINTTVGVFGLFDPAGNVDLPRKPETLGTTLGKWGVGNGVYLMVPAAGPNTIRNATGAYGDTHIFPISSLSMTQMAVKFVMLGLETRIELMDQEALLEQSLDSYNFVKEAYYQNDEFKIKGSTAESEPAEDEEFDDFDDYDDSLE